MIRRLGTPALAVVTAAAMASSIAACGGSDSGSTSKKPAKPSTGAQARTIVSGVSVYVPDAAALAKLKSEGVTVTPEGAGSKVKGASFEIPAKGGRIIVKSLIGSVHSASSITFAKGGQKVTFSNVALNTESRKVTGEYKGKRIAIFQLRLNSLSAAKDKTGALVASKIGVVYARGAVALVNKTLGIKALRTKGTFGTVSFTVVARRDGGSGSAAKKAKSKSGHGKSSSTNSSTSSTEKKK